MYVTIIVWYFVTAPVVGQLLTHYIHCLPNPFLMLVLTQFSLTGVPDVISSDNATNFRRNLTTEFLKRLGCCPRFSTPAHPQACGLMERMVGSIKSAISKVAIDHPKQWYTHLPFILWALNLRKCYFALSEVLFVGQIIGSGSRRADPDKTAAVENMSIPVNKKQVKQMLGFFSYFREFIPDFAQQAYHLSELTKKGRPDKVIWGAKEQQAFDRLKTLLIKAASAPLAIMDCNKSFTICVDASDYAVTAAVTQPDENGQPRPVAFASVKLSPTQSKWSTVEKKAYAAIWVLQKFQRWVFGCPVTVLSDHNPLTFLTQASPRSAKLMRWTLALAEFDVTFKYREGKSNTAADCLSHIGPHPVE